MSTEPMKPTLKELLASVARELALRRAVYPKSTKLSESAKVHELACMTEVLRILTVLGRARQSLMASPELIDLSKRTAPLLGASPEAVLRNLVDVILDAMRGDDKESS